MGSHLVKIGVLVSIVRVDSKGRITLPKEVREKAGIKPGSRLVVYTRGSGEIVVRLVSRDPSEEIAEILGEFTLTRKDRVRAEKILLEDIR